MQRQAGVLGRGGVALDHRRGLAHAQVDPQRPVERLVHPARPAGRIARARFGPLVAAVRDVLLDALAEGGTTLRDFVDGDGRPGYFRHALAVYERRGVPCERCGAVIRRIVLGQRATYYCPRCQH